MLVHQIQQSLGRRLGHVHFRQNLDAVVGLGFQLGAHRLGVLRRADQQQPLLQLVLAKLALDPVPDHFLFDKHQEKTDPPEQDDDPTGGLFTSEERHQDHDQRRPHARPGQLPDRLPSQGQQRSIIKSVNLQ